MTLRLMRERGLLSQAEYDSAMHDLSDTAGATAGGQESIVVGKWATTFYGFVEADSIYDSTRSLNDLGGNALIARPDTTAGDNSRWQFGIRNSRFGFRLKAPEFHGVRATAQIEADFLGTQLPVGAGPYSTSAGTNVAFGTEGAFFSNATFRVRHLNLKLETPVVDILFGQYWALFGWQPQYNPNTVQIQGVPGEVFNRTPQFRVSKTLKAKPITFEAAVAAVRPAQRDGGLPDGQAGLRLAVDSWTGVQTVGSAGTQTSPLSVAVTGLLRHVSVNDFIAQRTQTQDLTLAAIAADAFLPVIPGKADKRDNSLSFNGEFTTGYGDADQFTSLTGGVGFPATAAGFSPDIDPGIVTYDYSGKLHGIQWTTYLFGAQYYLPGVDGRVFISGNYAHAESANSHYYTFITNSGTKPPFGCISGVTRTATSCGVMAAEDWFDVNLFVDPVPATRFGLEYANTKTTYVDGIHAINHRIQFSGFFIF
jgi:hypothetical protein